MVPISRIARTLTFSCAAGVALLAAGVSARQADPLEAVLGGISFRNIGPFRTSAWITDIAVPDAPAREHAYTVYAATRSGGLWRTANGGTSWDPIFDAAGVAAIGAVAVAPSDANVVWVGTGDQAAARSSYSGRGVFKSTDAGKTWEMMGLPDSHHIARIVIHPRDPNTVYVAAMGHLFSGNAERGVFRTTTGGKTWQKVLFVNDEVGAVDLVINRQTPAILYAATYEKHRMPWQLVLGGPGTALYRSDDGGTKWQKLEGGLPAGNLGRIGIDIYQKNPNILYAVVENVNPRPEGMGGAIDACQMGAAPRGGGAGGAAPQGRGGRGGAQRIGNEIFRSDDGGKTWRKTHDNGVDVAGGKAPYSFNQLKINPNNPDHLIITSDQMYTSKDGGKSWSCSNADGFFRSVFGDFRSIWWDAEDSNRIMIGSDGGLNISVDGGRTADYSVGMRVGEVYAIGVDMDDPYNVYAGLQDHDSWKGPSNSKRGRITLEDWTTVGPGDGMYNQVDPTDSRWVYNTREMGNHGRLDQQTGQRTVIAPPQRPADQPRLRYNWVAPIVLSPHNPQILYAGAQLVFRSKNRGDAWEEISPDLTTGDTTRCGNNSGNVPYCTITSISESPLTAGVIWVGTDDGKVHVTQNAGGSWSDVTAAVAAAGGPADRYTSRVFASPHDAGTAFVAKSGFRNDDFRPFLLRTTDFGKTWRSIAGNLPASPINVVVQDRKNRNLLIAGNDLGVYVSIDGGVAWSRLKANLPTVAVHDLTVHPRENDLVLGTYGRGVFVADITPLQELSTTVLAKPAHLFDIEPKASYGFGGIGNWRLYGDRYIGTPNEPEAIVINYFVKTPQTNGVRVTVADASGKVISQLAGPAVAGLNRITWNMRAGGAPVGGRGGGGGGGFGGGATLPPGEYQVTLDVGGATQTKPARIRARSR